MVLNGKSSEFLNIFGSVPQESILSSLFFLVYLNDIDENIKSDMFLFADDVALINKLKNLKTLENEINSDLKNLNDWVCKWNMDFNPSKTDLMIFLNKKIKSQTKYQFEKTPISQVSEHKKMGLFLSSDMKWTSHIDYIIHKTRKKNWDCCTGNVKI